MAKMIANYATKVLGLKPDTTRDCTFDDVANVSPELQWYITEACQLGLMGVGINNFDPNGWVTRAQLGTMLSRALYGNTYNHDGILYYEEHLQALKDHGIITNTNPNIKEIRWYFMLMLYRTKTNK